MIYCVLAKFLISLLGLVIIVLFETLPNYIIAFILGILPIWSEVLTTKITKIEPALTKSKKWLVIDALVDAFSFVLIPSSWFGIHTIKQTISVNQKMQLLALFAFVACGLWRLIQFVRTGLNKDNYFRGVPVTYMGYLWILLILLENLNLQILTSFVLLLASWSMISKHIKVKVSSVT